MDKGDDPIAAFGSAEEGEEPLLPYIDTLVFEQVDRETQKEQLTAIFDAITLAGVDYYLEVQETATGKQYILTKDDKAITTQVMDSHFKDNILEALDEHQNN
ncbi:hypothetical protein ACS8FD_01580 [Psychrobacter sp. 1U2]|uniref:hypothetical protein n=1 Tax=Psychrobacter sp. 1U2 TaxID=3453577 RepID=UPI003F45F8F0